METHDQHHEEEHHVIGLVPSIIFLILLTIAVIWYSMASNGTGPYLR